LFAVSSNRVMCLCCRILWVSDSGRKRAILMARVFAYSRSGAENVKEASKLMEKVLGLRQKIAGMSIPLEVRSYYLSKTTPLLTCWGLLPEICSSQSPQVQTPRPTGPPCPRARVPLLAHAPRVVVAGKMLPSRILMWNNLFMATEPV
jgi:hypothetical protein